jgi:hypothetical protein
VAVSGLVGGLSHVFLDGFTHGNHAGWALAFVPALATPVPHLGGVAPLHDALQLWLTIVLGGLALHEWDRMARALPSAPPAPDGAGVRARGTSGRVRLGLTVAAILGAVLAPVLKHAPSPEVVLELAAYGALTFATGAAVLAALAHRVRVLLDRQRLETDRALES